MFKSLAFGLVAIGSAVLFADFADARSPHCHRHLGRRHHGGSQVAYYQSAYAYTTPQVAYYRAPTYAAYSTPTYWGSGYAGYSGLGYSSSYRYPYSGYGVYGGYGNYGNYGNYGYGYGYGYPAANYWGGYGRGLGTAYYGPSVGIPGTGLRIGF